MKEIFVNMGKIEILTRVGILTTVGLGSCVGVTLYDFNKKIGALAHVFLADSTKTNKAISLPGKYADTAIPALIEIMEKQGANKTRLIAKIAGGAHLFPNLNSSAINVGEQNIRAVIEQLSKANIPIKGRDIGGAYGRKMKLMIDTGTVVVTAIGKESIEI